jgi:hypothetical protein
MCAPGIRRSLQTGAAGSRVVPIRGRNTRESVKTSLIIYQPALHPSQLTCNQLINANLDTVGDVDFYAIQTPSAQTASQLTFTVTGTQTAQLETQRNTWATLTSGTSYNITCVGRSDPDFTLL